MDEHSTSNRVVDALTLARHQWRRHLSEELRTMPNLPPAPPRWTIAISREAGIDASAIAQPLAESLGWTVYDRELVEQIAQESGLRKELVESLDESPAERFHGLLDHLLGIHDTNVDRYLRSLTECVCALAARGHCILVGRGAAVALPVESTLAIRLVAPLSARVASLRAASGLTEKAARNEIERVDTERSKFVSTHFHKNPDDSSNYDLVLNVSRLSHMQCAAIIAEAYQQLRAGSRT
jgi:cytidylate kinase